MTEAQKHFRKQLLTKIHINANFKTIKANEAWEEWLLARFGVESCKELSINELGLVLDFLNGKKEWNGEAIKADFGGRAITNESKITNKQIVQILALKEALKWSDSKFRVFIFKQTKLMLWSNESIYKFSKKQGSAIITGLEKIAVGYTRKEFKK